MSHPKGVLDADMLVMEEASIRLSQGVYSVTAEILLVNSSTGRTLASSTITAWPNQASIGKAAGDFIAALEEAAAEMLMNVSSSEAASSSKAEEKNVAGLSEHLGADEEDDDVPQG